MPLPPNATVFDPVNADAIARSVILFGTTLPGIVGKSEEAVTVGDIINAATDPVTGRDRNSRSRVAAINVDDVCDTGSVSDDITDTGNEREGTATYDDCEPVSQPGIFISGVVSIFETYDNGAGTYDYQIGGTLTVNDGSDTITIVLNITEKGNENTGVFSDNLSYSAAGVPQATYLVTTAKDVKGDYSPPALSSGKLIVTGGANTRLRLDVVPGNMMDVDLDTGTGTFVNHSTIDLATI